MCYRCELCGVIVPPNVPCNRVVTQTRKKFYPVRQKANTGYISKGGSLRRSGKWQDRADDPGGAGLEAAQEANVCLTCACAVKSHAASLS